MYTELRVHDDGAAADGDWLLKDWETHGGARVYDAADGLPRGRYVRTRPEPTANLCAPKEMKLSPKEMKLRESL